MTSEVNAVPKQRGWVMKLVRGGVLPCSKNEEKRRERCFPFLVYIAHVEFKLKQKPFWDKVNVCLCPESRSCSIVNVHLSENFLVMFSP